MNNLLLKNQYQDSLPKWKEFSNRMEDLLITIFAPHNFVYKIESRIKSLGSIEDKLRRLKINNLNEIRDIVGFRIIVATQYDMIKTCKLLISELKVDEIRYYNINDKIVNVINDSIKYLSFQSSIHLKASSFESIFFYSGISTKRSHLPEWNQFIDHRAEIQIMTVFFNAYSEACHALQYKANDKAIIDIPVIDVTSRLTLILNQFQKLINNNKIHEKKDIHPFLEKHFFILHPNPAELFSEVAIGLGTEFKIDFLIRESDGKYLLVEIENPKHPLFIKAGDFSCQVNHALKQVEDWQQWIEDNLPLVQRKYPDMISPCGLVVIGRSQNLSNRERQRLERRNINFRGKIIIWTYDDLVKNAKSFIESIKNNLLLGA
jgi:ppGpp synthetase/RelA/SpoT-type nucleotidyltranferase